MSFQGLKPVGKVGKQPSTRDRAKYPGRHYRIAQGSAQPSALRVHGAPNEGDEERDGIAQDPLETALTAPDHPAG